MARASINRAGKQLPVFCPLLDPARPGLAALQMEQVTHRGGSPVDLLGYSPVAVRWILSLREGLLSLGRI